MCESAPPVATRQNVSFFEVSQIPACISMLKTGSRLCHEISGVVHHIIPTQTLNGTICKCNNNKRERRSAMSNLFQLVTLFPPERVFHFYIQS